MKRILTLILLFCFSVSIGIGAVGLAKTLRNSNQLKLYVSPRAMADYKTAINTEEKNIEQLDLLIADAQKKLEDYQGISEQLESSDLEEKMLSELNYYKAAAGAMAMEGEGVVITVDDSTKELGEWDNLNDYLVHDNDLLRIIDELNAAGAEVISVKGQRLGNISSVACAGYTVQINGQKFARPFEIRAIGDAKRMAAALIGPGGIGAQLRDVWNLQFNLEVRDKLMIAAYPDDQTFVYMSKVKEEETN